MVFGPIGRIQRFVRIGALGVGLSGRLPNRLADAGVACDGGRQLAESLLRSAQAALCPESALTSVQPLIQRAVRDKFLRNLNNFDAPPPQAVPQFVRRLIELLGFRSDLVAERSATSTTSAARARLKARSARRFSRQISTGAGGGILAAMISGQSNWTSGFCRSSERWVSGSNGVRPTLTPGGVRNQ